ncbi:MAG: RNA-binding protein [Firmicutes bacterium]|nr:RNA-binding protein [Bacillota bacterium]
MADNVKEEKMILAKALDELDKCQRENRICHTDFLDMRMQGLLAQELKLSGADWFFEGGYDTSERRMAVFLPDWAEKKDFYEDDPMEVLRVTHKEGGKVLTHRDYLGSVLGLGISRAKVGDIIVCSKGADIIIDRDLEEFLLANYFKAGRTELSLSVVPISDINLSEVRTEFIKDTLASLRLDAFLASAYRCARSKAQEAVKQGLVFVNNAECLKADKELSEGDVVVLRGKGKCVLEEVGGTSKKDRTFITIKKYI